MIKMINLPACPLLQLQPQFQDPGQKFPLAVGNQNIRPSAGLPLPF